MIKYQYCALSKTICNLIEKFIEKIHFNYLKLKIRLPYITVCVKYNKINYMLTFQWRPFDYN